MLRKELRRRLRRREIRTRLVAGVTAIAIGLGLAVGGTAVATANPNATLSTPVVNTGGVVTYNQNGLVCNSSLINFQKPDAIDGSNLNSDGSYSAAWGSLAWDVRERTVTWSITPGWDVDVCVKGGTYLSTIDTSTASGSSYTHTYAGLSHLGFRVNASTATNDLNCEVATNYTGRALTNGDHINMDIVQDGKKFQVNAQVDRRQSQDPASESGLVLRVNAPGGPYTLPITNAQRDAGTLSFSYASYLKGSFTVEWVQFNSTYFNKDRDKTRFLVCGDLPTGKLVTPTATMVTLTCDAAGSYTLDAVEGIRWFVGDTEVKPGTYAVGTASTIVVRAEAIAPDYGLEPGAKSEFTFVFTKPKDCALPCLPASAVSYTYYNLTTATSGNPANSGLITVTAREGYSTELCDDFWVVAASWNYSSSTSIWPQTLRSTDPAGDHPQGYVGGVGTYFFHAPVACGQGDVYASFTGMPYVGPELFGPSNPFAERFLHQMGFTGPNPTYLNTAPGCNVANPVAPTATPIVECGTYGSISISDVANPYIGYTIYRGAAVNGSVDGLSTVNLTDATEGVFTVVATPLNGYIFPSGTVRQWEFDLGEYRDCPVDVNLTLTYMEECAPDSTYTFRVRNAQSFSVPYTFTVAGNPALNGSGVAAPGDSFFDLDLPRTNPAQSYTVTLKWGDGTTILAEQTTKASGRDKVCELTVEPVVDITCATPGSYTVPAVVGVSWTIGGQPVAPGTYTVEDPSTLTLRATAASGYVLYLNGQLSTTRDFTLTFTEPGPCAEPTFDGRTVTAAECDNDTPWIDFTVVVNDPDGQLTNRTATLTFVHPTDPAQNHVVELGDLGTGNVLEGRILWPGASVDPVTSEPTGWPGWAFVDGQWVETTGNFAWTRSLTEVTLTVNPEMQIAIAYPPATPECVAGPVELEPIPVKETCLTDGQAAYDLPAITGVTWFVNGQQRDAGTYPVLAAETVEITFAIDPAAVGGPYALKPGAAESFTFAFTAGDLCDLPELPVTNASIAFLEPTCDLGQQLDPANFVVEDAALARYAPELSDLEGPTYAVVFVITDEDAVFFDSSEPVAGRTVSNGGKMLTFTGTLLGPDRSEECVTVVELRDPVSYVDTCFEQSVTITRVVGIAYTVFINDETPVVVEWVGDETTRTIAVDEGDSVRVVPSPASDRYTISPEPAPFERTFDVYPFECLETSPLTTASASFTPATCEDMTNWVTLEETDGVQWWVNGRQAEAGTWPMSTGETVVTVTPLPGFGFSAEQPTRWEFDGVDPSAECLELASTGVSQTALTAGIAGLVMLLLGAGILGYRRQRA
jgi:LPXTG-motif cell wall-anchored protein